jgi:hypothetical protein
MRIAGGDKMISDKNVSDVEFVEVVPYSGAVYTVPAVSLMVVEPGNLGVEVIITLDELKAMVAELEG